MLLGLCLCPAQHAWPGVKVPGQLSHYPSRLGRASLVSEGNLAKLPETLMCKPWAGRVQRTMSAEGRMLWTSRASRHAVAVPLRCLEHRVQAWPWTPVPSLAYMALPEIWEPSLPSFLEAGCRHQPPQDGVSREERIRSGFRSWIHHAPVERPCTHGLISLRLSCHSSKMGTMVASLPWRLNVTFVISLSPHSEIGTIIIAISQTRKLRPRKL